jgi:excisionase family DNA binding protein
MKKTLSASQIAKYEEVAAETVTRWIRKGYFSGVRRVGRRYKIPLESYHKWRANTEIKIKEDD